MSESAAKSPALRGRLRFASHPSRVAAVQERLADPASSLREVAAEIALDPPLVARVLRVANGARYGLAVPTLSLEHASSVLGTGALSDLLRRVETLEESPSENSPEDALWHRPALAAAIVRLLPARVLGGRSAEELAVLASLLGLGRHVLLGLDREKAVELFERERGSTRDPRPAEREAFGVDHVRAGTFLAERWRLPNPVAQAIAVHHETERDVLARPGVLPLLFADRLATLLERPGEPPSHPRDILPPGTSILLPMTPREVAALAQQAREIADALARKDTRG